MRQLSAFVVLAFTCTAWTSAQYQPFGKIDDNTNGCPPVTEKPVSQCEGHFSTCWSPGVRDTDCPSNGYCCFDGCAATCLGFEQPPFKIAPSKHHHKKKKHHHETFSVKHYEPKAVAAKPYTPKPALAYPKEVPEYPTTPKIRAEVTPRPKPHHLPRRTAVRYPVHPGIRTITSCPTTTPKNPYCSPHSAHQCWSPGHPDIDCPNSGLCCFDGCANRCINSVVHPTPPTRTIPPPPTNPCKPSPCGPGTTCTVNEDHNPVCQCHPGLIPKPDTITGCGPECTRDADCGYGLICHNQQCVEKPDPCNPSPCGPGTTCQEDRNGNPVCQCEHGLVPKPDTITGCGPECTIDRDCDHGYKCEHHRCVIDDPCSPSPCGPRTTCTVGRHNNPICNCLPGYVPKPDTVTGCGPECVIDNDCKHGFMCEDYHCVERPDPCYPSPCGPGANCRVGTYNNAICECLPGLIPQPDTVTGCGPECVHDHDCKLGFICRDQRCVEKPDPCQPSPCGPGTTCTVNHNGNPICRCEPGLVPMPDSIIGCGPECRIDPDCEHGFVCENQRCVEKPDPCNPSPCGPGTSCKVNSYGNPICQCYPGLVPKPDTITGCGPECVVDSDCDYGYICRHEKCVEKPDPCYPNPCGMMAICTPKGLDDYTCQCQKGTFGDAYAGCQEGECLSDDDCALDKACLDYFCINPCLTNSTCRQQDFCQVRNHIPVCGFNYDQPPQVRTPIVIGGRYAPAEPAGRTKTPIVIGGRYNGGSRRGGSAVIVDARRGSGGGVVIGGSNYGRKKRHALNRLLRSKQEKKK